jgi:hypothetical protein
MFSNGKVEFFRLPKSIFMSVSPTRAMSDEQTGKSATERMIGPAEIKRYGFLLPIFVIVWSLFHEKYITRNETNHRLMLPTVAL